MTTEIRLANKEDMPNINAIYNREIREGTATWHLAEWDEPERLEWFAEHTAENGEPILVYSEQGVIAGFAYLTKYRGARGGYRYTRESTVYVDEKFQGQGIGTCLLDALIQAARDYGLHVLVAWIDSENVASINLHKKMGFSTVGIEPETGHKFGSWRSNQEMAFVLEQEGDDE